MHVCVCVHRTHVPFVLLFGFAFWLFGACFAAPTNNKQAQSWALDDITYYTEMTDFERLEQVRSAPREGVYVHGLYLDGCRWSKGEQSLVESEPKKLFAATPVLYVTAVTKALGKSKTAALGVTYDCPCYKYPARTDLYLIFIAKLPSKHHKPTHWILRGVALLCSTD